VGFTGTARRAADSPMSQAEPQPVEPEPTDNRSGQPPVHPLAALLLLVVDNLWSLGD